MKYAIYYSIPNDVLRYMMSARDEKQLAIFVKMLVDEKAYNIRVEFDEYDD